MLKVLIVDDQPHVLDAMELLFEMRGKLEVVRAASPEEAESVVRSGGVGVVVQDMNYAEGTTRGQEGVALFRKIRELDSEMPVILMTAWASLSRAVQLVKEGADDYLQKPWDDELLLRKVTTLLRIREQTTTRQAGVSGGHHLCGLLFESPQMHAVVSLALKVARSDVSVLITGPNGSGKEKLAEIVQANSARRDGPFVKVNVGALPDELFAAELFGAEPGAYTGAKGRRQGRFEAADGGTLFLDEIGNLSMESQAKLLRALQSGEFERLGSNQTRKANVRVVAATNVDMQQAIAQQRFREDLFYRLAVIELEVPALRDRPADIEPLARSFADAYREAQSERISLGDDCVEALESHAWPGNVRELQNRIRRGLLIAEGNVLTAAHLGLGSPEVVPASREGVDRNPSGSAAPPVSPDTLDQAERDAIERALEQADYVVARAATALGLSRQALYRRMQRLGVRVKRDLGG